MIADSAVCPDRCIFAPRWIALLRAP